MPGFVYILECSDGSYYVGSTVDLDRRVNEHNDGKGAAYTSRRRPVRVVFSEQFPTVEEAYRLEKRIQGWSRGKRRALIDGDFDLLRDLARRPGARAKDAGGAEPAP
ncbi:GIY-YIG nuclease family protein [Gordonia polyisoprenivorans]|uniref:GIY-YIG nuclease family protein n=1 Tax=Gordonia polyisoprenivorans TaxID=84595 RepID=UPI001AD68AD1|nr:GIY-YIG nuclease family protein [Gordonia polyisoprenivorans]QTI69344.1 GIY-YIG nuclease family protein [Gordonia polyisoprenivorans]